MLNPTNPTTKSVPEILEHIAGDLDETASLSDNPGYQSGLRQYAIVLRQGAARFRQLESDNALSEDVITKLKKWVEDAKPLLAEGGLFKQKFLTLSGEIQQGDVGEILREMRELRATIATQADQLVDAEKKCTELSKALAAAEQQIIRP